MSTAAEATTPGSNRDLFRPQFDLTDEQQEILDQADRWSQAELYPLSEKMDNEEAQGSIGEEELSDQVARESRQLRTNTFDMDELPDDWPEAQESSAEECYKKKNQVATQLLF